MINRVGSYSCFDDDVFNKLQQKLAHFQPLTTVSGYPGRQSSIDGKYSFDDGTIWKVVEGEDGKQYIIKQVENDEIVRFAYANICVNKENVRNLGEALNLFHFTDDTYKYLSKSNTIIDELCIEVSKTLNDYIDKYITDNNLTVNKDNIIEVIKNIGSEVDTIEDINEIIKGGIL